MQENRLPSPRAERVKCNLDRIGALETARRICGGDLDDVVGCSRRARFTILRYELWSVIHGTLGFTCTELARVFEVNHSTILHGLEVRHGRLVREAA